ncbi:uncharacterized protein RMCFA_4196 [Mycolicibacterium fortuitum subsp. acetamidolyticum]|uniref:Uncharacterized protein n=1 Tax=Mycolicibacterium fortuitum subsp. acetamidolyticum TaxID=144550 RepID=A0A100WU05_MYCFO|nr:uncharacterized protein RMCFA_4196 [Mycolicibacterium fortuitum subsp. acetamidolyticum]
MHVCLGHGQRRVGDGELFGVARDRYDGVAGAEGATGEQTSGCTVGTEDDDSHASLPIRH